MGPLFKPIETSDVAVFEGHIFFDSLPAMSYITWMALGLFLVSILYLCALVWNRKTVLDRVRELPEEIIDLVETFIIDEYMEPDDTCPVCGLSDVFWTRKKWYI